MPYTLVHPGFVIPLRKWNKNWFLLESLIIGSFVPDYDIIFRFTENRFHLYTFTFLNILTVIYPISIFSYFFYYVFLRKTIYYLFSIKNEIQPIHLKDYKILFKIIISLFIAVNMHIILDFFTHPDAYKLYLWIIHHSSFNISKEKILFFCLYGPLSISSLLGAVLLIICLPKDDSTIRQSIWKLFKGKRIYFWIMQLFILIIVFVAKVEINGLEKDFIIDSILLYSLSGFFYGFIISCFLFRVIFKDIILGN